VRLEHGGDARGEAKPLHPRHREQRRLDLARFELLEPRLGIATKRQDAEIGTRMKELRTAPR
jgi:hypothetical protein